MATDCRRGPHHRRWAAHWHGSRSTAAYGGDGEGGRHQTDVVVGGGPAGLAAAIAARLQGLRVVVLEAAHPPIAGVRSTGYMPRPWPAATGRHIRLALTPLGDASGGVDAISGAGLCLAFQQAEPLGKALAIGDPALYASAHRGLARRPGLMASLMLLMDGRPWLRRWAMRVLTAEPAHFARLVALHVGQRVPPTGAGGHSLPDALRSTVCRRTRVIRLPHAIIQLWQHLPNAGGPQAYAKNLHLW